MKRLDVSLFSPIVTCTQTFHDDDVDMVAFEARVRADVLDWCAQRLTHPVMADRAYRSGPTIGFDHLRPYVGGLPHEDYPLPADATYLGLFGTGTLRLMFGSAGDRYLFVQRWGDGRDPLV